MKISFAEISEKNNPPAKASTLVFLVGEDKQFPQALQSLDKQTGGTFTHALKKSH